MNQPGADPLVGRTVAHYEIVARLGGGGMGVVYRAIDRKLGRPVALKFLPQQWSHDDGAKQRFLREAQAASATDHPNICTIHDIATADDGQLFIVMAHYAGETLKRRLEAGPLPIDEALDIATQVADGLARAHAQGIVHRDIKPGNLILTEDGVRIVDFGLATFVDALQLTIEGSTLGTAAYMSPEQVRGEEVDARTDVWAVGVVLYQMLVGHPPFRGAYAEAIGYAIRNDPPPPLRAERPEIPEEIEQLVFRALHKDPAIRFQSGRDLARALRQVRGLTLPVDLRTVAVLPPAPLPSPVRQRRGRVAAAIAVMALFVGAPAWVLLPTARVSVAIAPAVNETTYDELDGYGFALAEELAAALRESGAVRVVPAARVREILRAAREAGSEGIDRRSLEAIADQSGARFVLIPKLLRDDAAQIGARVELWETASATGGVSLDTAAITTALRPAAAYQVTLALAPLVEERFSSETFRSALSYRIRRALGRVEDPLPRMRSLAAAAAFERGLDAYEQLEYAAALQAFGEASTLDDQEPLPHAWSSRTLLLMRQDDAAAMAAVRAESRLGSSPAVDRLFVEAIVAEARGQFDIAQSTYAALVDRDASDPTFLVEQGGFLDRRNNYQGAVGSYRAALTLDAQLARPQLELCRQYGPTRMNEVVRAREHADLALKKYAALGSVAGEAQVRLCLADVLRQGDAAEKREARTHAEAALALLEGGKRPYQHARALYYVALAAAAEDRVADSLALNERALTAARATGNRALEPIVLQNIGVNHSALGSRALAVQYYSESSKLFNTLGDNQRAADMQANAGAMLIEFGDDPDRGLRDVQDALKVSRTLGNTRSEVFGLVVSAAYSRNAGRHPEADELLRRGLDVSTQRNLNGDLGALMLDRAKSRIDLGQYAAARKLIVDVLDAKTEQNRPRYPLTANNRIEAEIRLAQIDTRVGDFASARKRLDGLSADIERRKDQSRRLLQHAALGELAYEEGRLADARKHFAGPAGEWRSEWPHVRAVESFAYVGFIDALSGDVVRGVQALEKSVAQARIMKRLALEARCRVFLARLALRQRRPEEALNVLTGIPEDNQTTTVGPELRAQVRFWRGQALRMRGEAAADAEIAAAKRLLGEVRSGLEEGDRERFSARTDVRLILE